MAYEIKAWGSPGCFLTLPISRFSSREPFSREINQRFGVGGALNANYTTVEAAMVVANLLGTIGLEYGIDFVFKTTCGPTNEMLLDFRGTEKKKRAIKFLMKQKQPNVRMAKE